MFEPVLIAIWLLIVIGFNVPVYYLSKRSAIPQRMVLLAALLMSGGIYMAVEKVLSYPMPLTWELFPAESYVVLAYDIRVDQIYLLLDDGGGIPRYYVVPIRDKEGDLGKNMAERLPGMFQEASELNGGKLRYEPSLGQENGHGLMLEMPEAPGPKRVR